MAYIEVVNSKGERVRVDKIDDKLAHEKTKNSRSRVRMITEKEYKAAMKINSHG